MIVESKIVAGNGRSSYRLWLALAAIAIESREVLQGQRPEIWDSIDASSKVTYQSRSTFLQADRSRARTQRGERIVDLEIANATAAPRSSSHQAISHATRKAADAVACAEILRVSALAQLAEPDEEAEDEERTRHLTIPLTEEEWRKISVAAASGGLSRPEAARRSMRATGLI